jgi:hypothetical protein
MALASALTVQVLAGEGAELADVHTLADRAGEADCLLSAWSSAPLLRHPRCPAHVGEPPMFEQLALLP